MLTIVDKILLSPLWLISMLPLRVLYVGADILYILMYYLVGYRKKVVLENLRNSFPAKTNSELILISKKFFRFLCQYFIESIYLMSMSAKECNKRYKFKNPELIRNLKASGKNVIVASSHFGNWEWANNLSFFVGKPFYGTYRPLSNKLFDRLFITIRAKYGGIPISMKQTLRTLVDEKRKGRKFTVYLVGDQRPGYEDLEYWTTFLNQDTPVITGIEKLAKKFECAVVFMHIEMPKKGYYEVEFKLIEDEPSLSEEYQITENYIKQLEKVIIERPELWLWSHKRWKFKKEDYFPSHN